VVEYKKAKTKASDRKDTAAKLSETTFVIPSGPERWGPRLEWGPNECHSSCQSCLSGDTRAVACTSCKPTAKHHAIVDPKNGAGLCSAEPCQFCKPKQCCDSNHKHYIVDADTMSGVCVQHNDDCHPVCVESKSGAKVCSKGCLNFVKDQASTEGEDDELEGKWSLTMCKADKLVACKPARNQTSNAANAAKANSLPSSIALYTSLNETTPRKECITQKEVQLVAACTDMEEVDALEGFGVGPTCILAALNASRAWPEDFNATQITESKGNWTETMAAHSHRCQEAAWELISARKCTLLEPKNQEELVELHGDKCEDVALPF